MSEIVVGHLYNHDRNSKSTLPCKIGGLSAAFAGTRRCPYLAEMYLLRAMGFLGVRNAGASGGHLKGTTRQYFSVAHGILAEVGSVNRVFYM
jgi:hypothetical protein